MAVYQASFLEPANKAIDGSSTNEFSFVCNGTTDKYNAKAYRLSDNVQVYTTGEVPLSPVRYNGQKVLFYPTGGTFTNGVDYKWDVTTYSGASSATSFQVPFRANTTATLTSTIPSIITSQSYTFSFIYTQAQNVAIEYWFVEFFDSTNTIITKTDSFYNGNVSYKYSGFASGNSYSVQATAVNTNGTIVKSPLYNFSVSYAKPNINIIPTITQSFITSLVNIIWGAVVQITGVVSGTYTFIQNYGISNNWALSLGSGAYYSADLAIPQTFTKIVPIKANGFTTGKLVELSGTNGTYEVGYDGTRFYYNNKGIMGYSEPISLPTVDYQIFIRPTDAYVKINNVLYRISVS